MAKYEYVAMDGSGREQRGVLEAGSEQQATTQLKDKGLIPTRINEQQSSKSTALKKKKKGGAMQINIGGPPAIKKKQLTMITRQLAVLLDAGLPLVRSLKTLSKQAKKDIAVREVLAQIAQAVEEGAAFSEALARQKKSFSSLYVNMIRAGEAAGAMEKVLDRLAVFMEKAEKMRRQVKGALMYPVSVLVIALVITAGLMIGIVPKFKEIFDDLLAGEPLPGLTNFVIGISNFVQNYWYVALGGMIAIFVAMKVTLSTKGGAFFVDNLLLKTPPFGGLVTKVNTARLCQIFGTLLASGVGILQALEIVQSTTGNAVVAKALNNVHSAVKEGDSVAGPLEAAGIFPQMMISMVEVGEETGALPEMLERVALIYEEEVDVAVEGLTSLIEPIMIVFLAVIVGGIVIAMFLPMIKLMENMG